MQTLIFQTTTKRVQLLSGPSGDSTVLESFDNISTVRVNGTYYEVMQKQDEETNSSIPVMRVPISNTNMLIQK